MASLVSMPSNREMDLGLGLCQPSTAILLVGVAGTLYHMLAGDYRGMLWWIMVGVFGTGIFQALCFGGLEPVAWVLMSIPVLIVCFFLAVALFASRMRIENVREVPCDRCHKHHRHGDPCGEPEPRPCNSCGDRKKKECSSCRPACPSCNGGGCGRCLERSNTD